MAETIDIREQGTRELPESAPAMLQQMADCAKRLDSATGIKWPPGNADGDGAAVRWLRSIVETLWGRLGADAMSKTAAQAPTPDDSPRRKRNLPEATVEEPHFCTAMSAGPSARRMATLGQRHEAAERVRGQLQAVDAYRDRESARDAAEAARVADWAVGRADKPE